MKSSGLDQRQIVLANGSLLRIRSLHNGEDGPVRELCARLSLRTRQLRFFLPLPVVPEALVRMLAEVDDRRRLAVIAELDSVHGGHVVALGNIGGLDDDRAEMGLVVADAWQRQGIGVALAAALLQAAEDRGYRRFVIHGLLENAALRPLLNHVADVVSTSTRSGVSEVAFTRRRTAGAPDLTLVEATREGEEYYNASREHRPPVQDPLERAYERILAAQRAKGEQR